MECQTHFDAYLSTRLQISSASHHCRGSTPYSNPEKPCFAKLLSSGNHGGTDECPSLINAAIMAGRASPTQSVITIGYQEALWTTYWPHPCSLITEASAHPRGTVPIVSLNHLLKSNSLVLAVDDSGENYRICIPCRTLASSGNSFASLSSGESVMLSG